MSDKLWIRRVPVRILVLRKLGKDIRVEVLVDKVSHHEKPVLKLVWFTHVEVALLVIVDSDLNLGFSLFSH